MFLNLTGLIQTIKINMDNAVNNIFLSAYFKYKSTNGIIGTKI